jgi:hypothetical protein
VLVSEVHRETPIAIGPPRYATAILILLIAIGAVYLPDVGHGFVRDDVGWISKSRLSSWSDARDLFKAPSGLFRPLVSASFAAERDVCGVSPLCYGLTNFGLVVGCAIGVALLARALALSWSAAILASAMWIFNWHGISSAVLWISGRTAALLVLCATFAAVSFIKHRWVTAAALTFAAMMSKEEGVLLPIALLAWATIDAVSGGRPVLSRRNVGYAVACIAAAVLYYILHVQSGALTPATAPPYYRLDFSLRRFLSNGPEYLDRSATFAVVVGLVFCIGERSSIVEASRPHRRVFWFAAIWWVCGFAITMFLPVRSSLYACLPSVGVAIAVAAVITEAWSTLETRRRLRAVGIGLAIPFLLWPVYHARNKPLVAAAELSSRTLAALQQVALQSREGTAVLLADDRTIRPSLDTSFGTGLQEAVDLVVRPRLRVWMDPPPADAPPGRFVSPPHVDVTLTLRDGRLVQAP